MQKRTGFGCRLLVDPAGGTSFVHVANVITGWSGPNTSADVAETTVLADLYKTYKREQIDPGQATLSIAYDPLDTATQILVDLYDSGANAAWAQEFSDEGAGTITEVFTAMIVGFERTMEKGTLVTASLTLQVSGNAGFSGSGTVVDA
jgi:hypothetical protein